MEITEMLLTINENVDEVHEAGYSKGETAGFDAGKKAEYDAFWDEAQQNGARTNYEAGFAGKSWTDKNFKPKYPITTISYCHTMFYACGVEDGYEYIKDIDFSKCTTFGNSFVMSYFKHIGTIDFSSATNTGTAFNAMRKIITIDKIVSHENLIFDNSAFGSLSTLENIAFGGVIANNINFQWSTKLSKASITSIITHLSDTASGKKLTLSLTAIKTAFGADPADWDGDGTNDGWIGSNEWTALIDSKPNWDIVGV